MTLLKYSTGLDDPDHLKYYSTSRVTALWKGLFHCTE